MGKGNIGITPILIYTIIHILLLGEYISNSVTRHEGTQLYNIFDKAD